MKSFAGAAVRVLIIAIAIVPLVASAVGGGAGGAIPTCSQDTWTCTDWGACSTAGTQARTCTMTFDCSTATTPKPPEQQSCTPPAPPSPPPQQSGTAVSAPATPACTKDQWSCSAWSNKCDINGLQGRTCTLSFDCPAASTPPPTESQACDHLQCGNKTAMQDRIACRLNLAPAGISRELQIQYLPEECRVITNAAEKKDCVDRYRSFAPCWNIPEGEERFACASKMLNLGASVADALRACGSGNQTNCFADVREKTYYMIKFRFYDLEQRAEALALRGADLQAVAGFETTVELKKQAFDNAKSDDERRQVILDIRAAWQNFITAVKDQVK